MKYLLSFIAASLFSFSSLASLDGKFEGECASSGIFNLSKRSIYLFDDEKLIKQSLYFGSDICTEPLMTFTYYGEFNDTSEIDDLKTYPLDMTFNKVLVTVHSTNLRDSLDTIDFCGIEEWTVGKTIDATANSTNFLCPIWDTPKSYYTVVMTNDNELFLGDVEESRDDRPDDIDSSMRFQKIE